MLLAFSSHDPRRITETNHKHTINQRFRFLAIIKKHLFLGEKGGLFPEYFPI